MLLNIPLAVWFGAFTIAFLLITLFLGIAMVYFKKNVFRYHKIFALLTGILAAIHAPLAILLWFFGMVI